MRRVQAKRLLLGAIAAVLALAAVLYALSIPEPVRVPQVQLPALPVDGVPDTEATPAVEDVFSRPLFWSSRRPTEDEGMAFDPVSSVDGIRVLGVFITSDHHSALLSDGGRTARVIEGESFSGWVLEKVGTEGVTLTSSDERMALPVISPPSPAIRIGPGS